MSDATDDDLSSVLSGEGEEDGNENERSKSNSNSTQSGSVDKGEKRSSSLKEEMVDIDHIQGVIPGAEDGIDLEDEDKGAGDAGTDTKPKDRVKNIWPEIQEKFRPAEVRRLTEETVKEHLDGHPYDAEEMPKLIKVLTDAIQSKVRALDYKRYKIVTYVVLGERRGEGITSVTRCIWDPMSDCLATYTYLSETVFCSVAVYGIYFY